MHIPPKRRRRILSALHLRQQGLSLRKIAEQLNVSHATVRSDLQLIETHWSDIAAPAADDLLLDALHLLRDRLTQVAAEDLLQRWGDRLSVTEYLKAQDARDAQLVALVRESRRTINDIHRRAGQRQAQPDLYDIAPDAPQETTETTETTTESSATIQPEATISQPEQEIVAPTPPEKNSLQEPSTAPVPAPERGPAPSDNAAFADPIIEEAVALFPHLNGQPREDILNFLEQFTDPTQPNDRIPPRLCRRCRRRHLATRYLPLARCSMWEKGAETDTCGVAPVTRHPTATFGSLARNIRQLTCNATSIAFVISSQELRSHVESGIGGAP